MTQRQGGPGVLPERERVDQPMAPLDASTNLLPDEATVAEPRRNRFALRLATVVAVALLALVIAAALTGSNPEPADVAPQERSNAQVEPLGSDEHLLNQAAQLRASTDDDNLSASDLHLRKQAARGQSQASPALGSDRHLENQAARPLPDAE